MAANFATLAIFHLKIKFSFSHQSKRRWPFGHYHGILIGNHPEYTAFFLDKQLHFSHVAYES
jgi:hypothetical protein